MLLIVVTLCVATDACQLVSYTKCDFIYGLEVTGILLLVNPYVTRVTP